MAQPAPPPAPPPDDPSKRLQHNVALGLLIACPALVALPPRKLDWYTFGLASVWVYSANHLVVERSGRSILNHLAAPQGLPTERAKQVQKMMAPREKPMSPLEKLWMGDEKSDWRQRREEEEKEALEEGRGYSGLIMDQLKEVWTWKTAAQREKEADELEARQDAEEEAKRIAAEQPKR